jgi:hypothetical protein
MKSFANNATGYRRMMTAATNVAHIDEYVRIPLTVGEANCPTTRKAFMGRWLVGAVLDCGIKARPDETGLWWNRATDYSVAQTQRGRIIVFTREDYSSTREICGVYEDFAEFRAATVENGRYPKFPRNVVAAAAIALRQAVGNG